MMLAGSACGAGSNLAKVILRTTQRPV